jgi:hypothetical protein
MPWASRNRENLLRFGSLGKVDLTSGERIEAKRPSGIACTPLAAKLLGKA